MTTTTTVQDGQGHTVEQTVDNENGTGTRTTYNPDGSVKSAIPLTGLPVPSSESLNRRTVDDRLKIDLLAMQAIIDLDPATVVVTTFPQAQAAARDALRRDKDIARMLRRVGRVVLQTFDSVD